MSNLIQFADDLDNKTIGRFTFNRSTLLHSGKTEVVLTVYDEKSDLAFDEQLSFSPQELIDFCKEILLIESKQKGEIMSHGAQEEDKVVIQFVNGEQINGTVKHIPSESGDSWVIWGEDGSIAHVQHFETITILNRYAPVYHSNKGHEVTVPKR